MPGVAAWEPIHAYTAQQAAAITGSTDLVAADAPDAIHQARVATRRLRSALRTFSPLWSHRHRPLLRELRWFAALLGVPRDLEVIAGWTLTFADQLSIAIPARTMIVDHLHCERDEALVALRRELLGERYRCLLAALSKGAGEQWSQYAAVPATLVLPGLAAAPAVAALAMADMLPTDQSRGEALHRLRKQAKAARYGYEAVGPWGADGAAAWKEVTESLGIVQDAVVATALVAELPGTAAVAADFDRLSDCWAVEAQRAEAVAMAAITRAANLIEQIDNKVPDADPTDDM